MDIHTYNNPRETGEKAAEAAAGAIKRAVQKKNHANIILATGNSQLQMLDHLTRISGISWDKVSMFHLDEYIGISEIHPASFRRYLKENFIQKVSPLKEIFLIQGDRQDPEQECKRLGGIVSGMNMDVALIGIGENGHLAFNDPPADFDTIEPFLVVELDEACRKQQLGEGWFKELEDVPKRAISMSIHQIMLSEQLIVTVPDMRKAHAVRNSVKGPVTNLCPASILRNHQHCTLFLDLNSASLL